MSATVALTMALLGPGVADDLAVDQRCHWVEHPLVIAPRRVTGGQTVVRKPYVVAAIIKGKRLKRPARVVREYVCDESGALRDNGPGLLPPVVMAYEPVPVTGGGDVAPAWSAEPVTVAQGDDWSPAPLYALGAPVVVLGGQVVYVATPAVPEPAAWALMLAGLAGVMVLRRIRT